MNSFEKRMQHLKNLINERINQMLTKETPVTLYEPIRYTMEGGGKRLRPILLILSCQAVGGTVEDCLDAAVAIELFHNFTLVHDDIMDQDDTRRGRATVHRKWDPAVALLAGDGLVAMAYYALLKTKTAHIKKIAEIFTQGIIELCEGQALDKEFESRTDVTLDEYLTMIDKKTARLLTIASEIGAIIGEGTPEEIDTLKNFSKRLGRAFQIQDDLLDIVSEESVSGKTFGSDIKQGKRTYLWIHAFSVADKVTLTRMKQIMDSTQIGRAEILEMRQIFERTGTIKLAMQEVELHIHQAQDILQQIKPSEAREHLRSLLHWISKRSS